MYFAANIIISPFVKEVPWQLQPEEPKFVNGIDKLDGSPVLAPFCSDNSSKIEESSTTTDE
jgi:galactose-1-phosphate uridylyltransferase